MNKEALGKLYPLVIRAGVHWDVKTFPDYFKDIENLIDETIRAECKQTWEMNNKALEIAHSGAQTDGAHHKLWCIDQMVRALTGDAYEEWVAEYEEDGMYEWEVGIAP